MEHRPGMTHVIKNFDALATTPARTDALSIVEAGFAAIDTEAVLRTAVTVADGVMTTQGQSFDLSAYHNIYIVGFGKASCTAAAALESILKGKVRGGAVIGVSQHTCEVVDTYAGTHPMPSRLNYDLTKRVEEISRNADEHDLVLVIVSGGGSALLCSSMEECDQGQQLYESFLSSGGTIDELNTVRKHISSLKGGGLAEVLYPATVIGLVFSDVPGGDAASVASGPTYKDSTTINDARAIIDRYGLGEFSLVETPDDDRYFGKVHNFLVVSNDTALAAMREEAVRRGYDAQVVSSAKYLTPEEIAAGLLKNPAPGTVRCIGTETILKVPSGSAGAGGRNTHTALFMFERLNERQVFVSFASDGKDNADEAGALADAGIRKVADEGDLSAAASLTAFDSATFFGAAGGLLKTGPLESNVSDLIVLLEEKG